jgi:hypothetical protein
MFHVIKGIIWSGLSFVKTIYLNNNVLHCCLWIIDCILITFNNFNWKVFQSNTEPLFSLIKCRCVIYIYIIYAFFLVFSWIKPTFSLFSDSCTFSFSLCNEQDLHECCHVTRRQEWIICNSAYTQDNRGVYGACRWSFMNCIRRH